MSFREVNNLRKNGDLETALKMANDDLTNERSEWSFSALFWVLRDLCKNNLEHNTQNDAYSYFQQMEDILSRMDDDEGFAKRAVESLRKNFTEYGDQISQLTSWSKSGKEEEAYNGFVELNAQNPISANLHEDCGWIIFRYLKKKCAEIGSLASRKALFNYLQLNNKRPSLLHSQMLNVAMTVSEHYSDFKFLPFLELWGVDKFTDDDYYPSIFEGKNIDPLIERIIRRCFNLGYTLSEITNAFGNNCDIAIRIYAKNVFFELSKYYKENNNAAFFAQADEYFNAINGIDVKSEFHSKILSLYLYKLPEERNNDVIGVLAKWGMQNFAQEDWVREKDKNDDSKEYPSLVEKVVKRYFTALKDIGLNTTNANFISLYKQVVNKFKDEQTERNLAQIYAATKQKEEALSIYRKLLLSLNRFYVWKELADVTDDLNLKISALCKAILSEPKDEFLGEVHLSLAKLMIDQKLYQEAKRELLTYKETYEKNGWKLKYDYSLLCEQLAEGINTTKDNKEFYNSHLDVAEEFVYSDIQWVTMFISQLYTQKNDDGKEIKKAKLVSVKGDEMSIKQNQLQPSDSRFLGSCFDVKIYQDRIVLIKKSQTKIEDIINAVVGYVDYYNKEKNVYHIIGNEKKQYLLTTKINLSEGDFCRFYPIPQKEEKHSFLSFDILRGRKTTDNKTTNRPPTAIYAGVVDKEQAVSELPEKFAVIDHINEEKKIYHCISSDGLGIIIPFNQMPFNVVVKNFIKIRFVDKLKKDSSKEIVRIVVKIDNANSDEAIQKFPHKGAVVDGVNKAKQLFHCVFGTNKDIIVKFSDTDLRPSVGDYVSIRYAFQKDPDKTYRKMLDISMLQDCNRTLTKTVTGRIRISSNSRGRDFGFVDDYYVGEQFLFDVEDNDKVTIELVYDGTKWRTYKLEKVD